MDRSRQNRRMLVGAAMAVAGSLGLGIGIDLWWPTLFAAALVIVVAYVVRYR